MTFMSPIKPRPTQTSPAEYRTGLKQKVYFWRLFQVNMKSNLTPFTILINIQCLTEHIWYVIPKKKRKSKIFSPIYLHYNFMLTYQDTNKPINDSQHSGVPFSIITGWIASESLAHTAALHLYMWVSESWNNSHVQ